MNEKRKRKKENKSEKGIEEREITYRRDRLFYMEMYFE